MKKIALSLLLVPALSFSMASWQSVIDDKKEVMGQMAYQAIESQYITYKDNKSLKIADPVIKAIPIIESHEALIDIKDVQSNQISMLPDPATPFTAADCNSGFKAASKVRRTVFSKLKNMVTQLDHHAPDFGYKKNQVTIKVFEGLRDLKTQETLFTNKMKEIRAANNCMTEQEAFDETCKWVSPVVNNIPVHSTGGAVDIRLWNTATNDFIDMGPFGVIWGANTSAPTFSENLTPQQKNNRLYLLVAAVKAGLTNYPFEWWHLSSGDRYASYVHEKNSSARKAIYDSVKE